MYHYLSNIAGSRRRSTVVPYSSEILADLPAGWWRLGEASGTNAADSSGNGRNGTYVNSPTLSVAGAIAGSTAATLNGSSQYVNCGDVCDVGTSDFTLEAWIKTTSTGNYGIVGKSRATNSAQRYSLLHESGKLTALMSNGTSGTLGPTWTSTGLNDGNFHHVVATFDRNGNATLYVDGASVASGSIAAQDGTNFQTTNPFYIGAYQNITATGPLAGYYFPGTIDDVAIYLTALSGARIAAHYAARNNA